MERQRVDRSDRGGSTRGGADRVAIALGSNRGDRATAIARAVGALAAGGVTIERVSSLYETAAIDAPDASIDPAGPEAGRDFLNAVVVGWTALLPHELLARTQEIEDALGRDRDAPRNAARTIDIDILVLGAHLVEEAALTIPHASCRDRHFVLVPWAEVDGDATIPERSGVTGTVTEALARLEARTAPAARPRVERYGDLSAVASGEEEGR